ncbi:MAG: hypothetical protein IJB86_00490 [Clostridia bacterium]|nr:hypothetical protein [Clostridia bacterium]
MKKRIICIVLVLAILLCGDAVAFASTKNNGEVQLSGDVTEVIELLGITVLPHVRSGNVAYNLSDSNSANRHLGAMHYYVRSSSESETTVNYIKVYDGAPNITKDAVHHF